MQVLLWSRVLHRPKTETWIKTGPNWACPLLQYLRPELKLKQEVIFVLFLLQRWGDVPLMFLLTTIVTPPPFDLLGLLGWRTCFNPLLSGQIKTTSFGILFGTAWFILCYTLLLIHIPIGKRKCYCCSYVSTVWLSWTCWTSGCSHKASLMGSHLAHTRKQFSFLFFNWLLLNKRVWQASVRPVKCGWDHADSLIYLQVISS